MERGGLGKKQHGKQQDMGKKKKKNQDPEILFEPLDPAMPETRPPWTFALCMCSGYLLLHNTPPQNSVA